MKKGLYLNNSYNQKGTKHKLQKIREHSPHRIFNKQSMNISNKNLHITHILYFSYKNHQYIPYKNAKNRSGNLWNKTSIALQSKQIH